MQGPIADFANSPNSVVSPAGLGSVQLRTGFWSRWQSAIRNEGLRHGLTQLDKTGSLEAFDIAAGRSSAALRGFVYRDSDVYKWLEAASYMLANDPPDWLNEEVDALIERIEAAQHADGYINTSFSGRNADRRYSNLERDHEIYCAGHLVQAAIAHHRATGREHFIDIALRLADHLNKEFGRSGRLAACGHPVAEMALVELWRETGERSHLELAIRMLNARGHGVLGGSQYLLDHAPFRKQTRAVGHAVRALYLYAGATDIFMETGEQELLTRLLDLWKDVQNGKTHITGGVGARHEGEAFGESYELPNARAYCETCAAIASIQWNWRMFGITGSAEYLDVLETALYNGFLAGCSLDGTKYFYVNPLEANGRHERQAWYSCACCPPNIYRTIASVHGLMFVRRREDVIINIYDSATFDDGEIRLEVRSEYPHNGGVQVDVISSGDFGVTLRVPSWCSDASIRVCGGDAAPAQAGLHTIRRHWRGEEAIYLEMSMPPRRIYAHPRIRENRNCVAIARGPLVYCFESPDNPGGCVLDMLLGRSSALEEVRSDEFVEGMYGIRTDCQYLDTQGLPAYAEGFERVAKTSGRAIAIPYFAWGNRGPSEMIVWVAES